MCWTGPFEFRWLKEYIYNPSYYHHQIGSIHLSHCCHIFPWLCVWDGCTIIFCHLLHIYIPGKLGFCFHFWCSVYGICKQSDTLWPVGRVRLFEDYTISLSSLCRLIWRHWTTKMLVRYMLPSVCLRLRQFSQSSFIQYMGLCVFSLPISPVMIVRMCTLSYYHHQTGSINHCLGLGHETMVCAVCFTMFLWICDMTRLLRGTFHVLVVFAPNLVLCHLACSITILLGTLLTSDT